jgi:beta-xylosidase
MRRAKSLDGPWEQRQLNQVDMPIDREPNQGGLIQVPDGSWWFLTHQGNGDWWGRAMCLLPVTWIDGWPVIGEPGADGIGQMVWSARKPILGQPPCVPQTSDEFDGSKLAVQWEWNHHPRDEMWSLSERPGFLRLRAFKPLKAGDLLKAGNTLTQRGWRANGCEATVRLDVSGMADGQRAGLAHLAKTWCTVGVRQSAGGVRTIERVENGGSPLDGPALQSNVVWLRSRWGIEGQCQFSYSTDGRDFADIGKPYALTWGHYRGDRIGLFSFNDQSESGYVDVDWFHVSFDGPPGSARQSELEK